MFNWLLVNLIKTPSCQGGDRSKPKGAQDQGWVARADPSSK